MISDEDCIETMRYDIMYEPRDKEKMPNTTYEDWLKPFEIDLFEEYAPKLFNTYSKPKQLKKVMIELIELYIFYKQNRPNPEKDEGLSGNQITQLAYKLSPIPSKNKGYVKQIEDFRKHLLAIYKFMGGKNYGTAKGNEFKKQLQEVCANADKYVPKAPKIIVSKKPIKDYLLSLNLKGKSSIIDEFIKAIK